MSASIPASITPPLFVRLLRRLGRGAVRILTQVGRFGMLVVELFRALPEYRQWFPRALEQCEAVGYGSLFIVILTSGFAGAVTSLQAGYQFTGSVPVYVMGAVVAESIILELAPVLTGLILAGRIGARYAAELGTMRVTEQIDALEALGRNPVSHLLIPRIVAGVLMVPALVMLANVCGLAMGWLVSKSSLGITDADFIYGSRYFFRSFDLWYSLIKAEVFGIVVTLVPCYVGFTAESGAEGVGRATTTAVVISSVGILILDTVLARILLPS
ncbi:MAG TPA: ABC transporter permease [Gemmatimonadales bacterium]|jgi:phospholipid/cholesterol/gamma-HCH transport system permease protein